MKLDTFKGYAMVSFSGIIFIAAVVLLVLQWGNKADFSLYGKNFADVSTAVVIINAMIAGAAFVWLAPMLIRGIRILHKARLAQNAKTSQ